jgi:hypothetical protein
MRILDTALLRMALASWAFFVWFIAAEAGLLSARFQGQGILFRWQVWLLAGIFTVSLRDLLGSARCRKCQARELPTLRGLFSRGEIVCQWCLDRGALSATDEVLL